MSLKINQLNIILNKIINNKSYDLNSKEFEEFRETLMNKKNIKNYFLQDVHYILFEYFSSNINKKEEIIILEVLIKFSNNLNYNELLTTKINLLEKITYNILNDNLTNYDKYLELIENWLKNNNIIYDFINNKLNLIFEALYEIENKLKNNKEISKNFNFISFIIKHLLINQSCYEELISNKDFLKIIFIKIFKYSYGDENLLVEYYQIIAQMFNKINKNNELYSINLFLVINNINLSLSEIIFYKKSNKNFPFSLKEWNDENFINICINLSKIIYSLINNNIINYNLVKFCKSKFDLLFRFVILLEDLNIKDGLVNMVISIIKLSYNFKYHIPRCYRKISILLLKKTLLKVDITINNLIIKLNKYVIFNEKYIKQNLKLITSILCKNYDIKDLILKEFQDNLLLWDEFLYEKVLNNDFINDNNENDNFFEIKEKIIEIYDKEENYFLKKNDNNINNDFADKQFLYFKDEIYNENDNYFGFESNLIRKKYKSIFSIFK